MPASLDAKRLMLEVKSARWCSGRLKWRTGEPL